MHVKISMRMRKNFSEKSFLANDYENEIVFLLYSSWKSIDVPDGMLLLSTFLRTPLLTYELLSTARSTRRRTPLRSALVKLNFVDGPNSALHILNTHKAFVER